MAQSQAGNFEYIARLKFASLLRYTTTHAPSDITAPDYFKNSGNYMEAGDEIDIVIRNEDGSWTKGRVEVVKKTPTTTLVSLMGDWRSAGHNEPRKMVKHYVPGNSTWIVKDESGVVVARGLTKAEAEGMTGTSSPEVETTTGSDETGIVVAGAVGGGRFLVVEDLSDRLSPHLWARRAVEG